MNNKIEMKMKKNQLTMLVLFATMLGFTACSDDDKVSISTVGIYHYCRYNYRGAATDRWNLYF